MKKGLLFLLLIIFCNLVSANWFGKDKIMHLGGSTVFTYWSYGIGKNILEQETQESALLAASFSLNMGLMKEFTDKYIKKNSWSWPDLVYDAAGICLTFVLINNVDFLESR
jgi:uncharacterized protein YfiM (DUF2279 family)